MCQHGLHGPGSSTGVCGRDYFATGSATSASISSAHNRRRYYLAVDPHLTSIAAPEPDRFGQSLDLWFNATEAYATQLHEIDRDTYLSTKRQERERQRVLDEESIR